MDAGDGKDEGRNSNTHRPGFQLRCGILFQFAKETRDISAASAEIDVMVFINRHVRPIDHRSALAKNIVCLS